jgi:3-oxoacyl-[acyl-carrier-protein] synthase-3
MRCDGIGIASVADWLPGRVQTEGVLSAGGYDADEYRETGTEAVTVADDMAAPDMAVAAALRALEAAAVSPEEVSVLLHACLYHQGHDFWPVASYIQRCALPGNQALAVTVGQMSNGGLAALELGAAYLAAAPARSAALITAADRFCTPGFDRWRSDTGIVYGDGGAAAVLVKGDGCGRLLSIASVSDPSLEQMHRGGDPFTPAPWHNGQPLDIGRRKRAYLHQVGLSSTLERFGRGLREVVATALDEAGMTLPEVARFVLPNVGVKLIEREYLAHLDIEWSQTIWHEWGKYTGHLGAADQLAGLSELLTNRWVEVGDRVALIGVGAGFTWTCALVEIASLPSPAGPPDADRRP